MKPIPTILPLYAALLAIMFVVLSIRTIRQRRKLKIGLGDAGNKDMQRAMRVHANFAEYVPLCLLMIYWVEQSGVYAWFVHALCTVLIVGRLSHAYGVSQQRENFRFRIAGMSLTFAVLIACAVHLLWVAVKSL
jgi:uncharacterized membrane protein YecN with MAPEG domain